MRMMILPTKPATSAPRLLRSISVKAILRGQKSMRNMLRYRDRFGMDTGIVPKESDCSEGDIDICKVADKERTNTDKIYDIVLENSLPSVS